MFSYYPCVRFKKGEYVALGQLPAEILRYVEPRFVLPPTIEPDPEMGRKLEIHEIAFQTAERVGKHWFHSRAYLDTRFVADELGAEGIQKLFSLVQARNQKIIPVAPSNDLANPVWRKVLAQGNLKLAIVVDYEQVDIQQINKGLEFLGLTCEDCVIFVDFVGAYLKGAGGVVSAVFESLYSIGQWQRIVYQASNFPERNPAEYGKNKFVPRFEWDTFHEAIAECMVPLPVIGYGDFGADMGRMSFPRKKGRAKATMHIRYTGASHTAILFAEKTGRDADRMKALCLRLTRDEKIYSGQSYSAADDRLWRIAHDLEGPGTAATWRELNTLHHITRVVRDLGGLEGITFAAGGVSEAFEEQNLFEKEELDALQRKTSPKKV